MFEKIENMLFYDKNKKEIVKISGNFSSLGVTFLFLQET